jgi:hypothetical protein
MADRTSAALFAEIFSWAAEHNHGELDRFVRHLWDMSHGYDFHPYQMGADGSLVVLGLARPDPNEDGCFLYLGLDYKEAAE